LSVDENFYVTASQAPEARRHLGTRTVCCGREFRDLKEVDHILHAGDVGAAISDRARGTGRVAVARNDDGLGFAVTAPAMGLPSGSTRHDFHRRERDLGDLSEHGTCKSPAPVSISGHQPTGPVALELDQEIAAPHITSVQNVIDFLEDLENSRPQQTVRVEMTPSLTAPDAVT